MFALENEIRTNVGPCQSSLDVTLKTMGIERQPYHGTCLVRNQCHKLLKNDNIETFCNSVPAIVIQHVGHGPIYEESIQKCNIFKTLFTLYSKCHVVFNTADVLSDDVITALEFDIVSFMSFLRDNWPKVRMLHHSRDGGMLDVGFMGNRVENLVMPYSRRRSPAIKVLRMIVNCWST